VKAFELSHQVFDHPVIFVEVERGVYGIGGDFWELAEPFARWCSRHVFSYTWVPEMAATGQMQTLPSTMLRYVCFRPHRFVGA
jgi:hypothetical protein